jgi:hypothetical protein
MLISPSPFKSQRFLCGKVVVVLVVVVVAVVVLVLVEIRVELVVVVVIVGPLPESTKAGVVWNSYPVKTELAENLILVVPVKEARVEKFRVKSRMGT